MHEPYLANTTTGVLDIELRPTDDFLNRTDLQPTEGNTERRPGEGLAVKVTFAVGTEDTAWVTIDGSGNIHPAFGGTGISGRELDEYVQKAVDIRSAITGDDSACKLTKTVQPA